ncbi:RIO1-domain-containing protein [Russula ochroleuca]|uniref:Serine/threonine-protein kinase RIO2 n=1 Tax=Russula ochroleuca TaxID=152965 RepID=A0A9P5MXK0_9AGAM|nr:RIO1-domain-containing protein [Russula ochroleuca]
MKLDATDLRYVTPDEFRVLMAVEMGSKNHEVVPSPLIAQISSLRNGGVNKILGILAKRNLVARAQNSKYEGYRLTYGGYDYLAMRALSKRDSMYSVGNQIGVGKESDIYIVANSEGQEMVLKLHRLGRVSFRAIKEKRDYLGKRKSASWMYMSRLAAQKEWAFLKVLHDHQFPVPRPIDQARHCILMELIDAYPLRQIDQVPSPGKLYSQLMDLIVRFARAGLIHGDFNEFNILIRRDDGEPIVIDFPQMVSTSHENAEWYFNRDVECIRAFFRRRFRYESAIYPKFKSTAGDGSKDDGFRLDVIVEASGFGRREMKVLEQYMESTKGSQSDSEDESEEEEADEEEEGSEGEVVEGSERAEVEEDVEDVGLSVEESEHEDEEPDGSAKLWRADSEEQANKGQASTESQSRDSVSVGQLASKVERTLSVNNASKEKEIRDKAAIEAYKQRAREKQKHHSRRGAERIGRAKGSKAKQDNRVKLDKGGLWD